jgi:hypothetical protein
MTSSRTPLTCASHQAQTPRGCVVLAVEREHSWSSKNPNVPRASGAKNTIKPSLGSTRCGVNTLPSGTAASDVGPPAPLPTACVATEQTTPPIVSSRRHHLSPKQRKDERPMSGRFLSAFEDAQFILMRQPQRTRGVKNSEVRLGR